MSSTGETLLTYPVQMLRYAFSGDDRPVIMEGDVNIWPPHITLRNIARALEGRLPNEQDRCTNVTFLDYGAAHVVVVVETLMENKYVVRITAAVFENFRRTHPLWQSFKESSEVASMVALRKMTKIPVPRVYVFDEDKNNTVGGAWTLEEYMDGKTLAELQPQLSRKALVQAIEQVAGWMLQVFNLEFHRIGSLHCTGTLKDSRNLSESDLQIYVGKMVTMHGLRHQRIVGPPKDSGPWDDAKAWLKSIAQGDMMYRRQEESEPAQEYIDQVQAIIDEAPELNGLFLSGPLSVNAPRAPDMWNFHNIKAVLDDDGNVTLVALLDMEGMQVVPRWVLGQAPRIQDLDAEGSKMLLDLLLKDPVFKQAHEQGLRARHLLNLAGNARWPDPEGGRIKKFREGVWEDMATLAG